MHRLANYDVGARRATSGSRLAAQAAFGVGCAIVAIIVRTAVDILAPGAGPFALVYPAVLVATLYGHWQAGITSFALTFAWVWYVVLAPSMSFAVGGPGELARIGLNAASAGLVIVFAEAFRRAVRTAAAEREMLRKELEHRTKNNFQLMTSLLRLQQRREEDPTARQALALAARRVSSFASAYEFLPIAPSIGETLPLRPYLEQVIDEVARAVFDDHIEIRADIADLLLPRKTAMAIGLYTNEALTNCAKHAFDSEQPGCVTVTLYGEGSGWTLDIRDDGKGAGRPSEGSGSIFMEAFAKQAGAIHSRKFPGVGCAVQLHSASRDGRETAARP